MSDFIHLQRYSQALLQTQFGEFRIVIYRPRETSEEVDPCLIEEHVALLHGDIEGAEEVFTRVHSECFTGEVIGSMGCDCREQLDQAMARMAAEDCGVLVYLRQEGRGIGLGNKIRAYEVQQEQGVDTVDANEAIGFPVDLRSFELAAAILKDLGVKSVRLNTNNGRKITGLERAGIPVTERVPSEATVHHHNRGYLMAKQNRLGHLFSKKLQLLE